MNDDIDTAERSAGERVLIAAGWTPRAIEGREVWRDPVSGREFHTWRAIEIVQGERTLTTGARLSGLIDAMRSDARFNDVREALRVAFDLTCGVASFTSWERRPREALWRGEWERVSVDVAARISATVDEPMREHALRRWSAHCAIVNALWERVL